MAAPHPIDDSPQEHALAALQLLDRELVNAASSGDYAALNNALLAGARTDIDGGLALRMAATRGDVAMIDRLLAAGSDIRAWGERALLDASQVRQHAAVMRLIAAGANSAVIIQRLRATDNHRQAQWLLDVQQRCWAEQIAAAVGEGADDGGAAPHSAGLGL